MKISLNDQIKYPKFTQYIKLQFPKLINNATVVKNALTWGKSPKIVITDLHSGQCGVPQAYGCFRYAKPKKIEIHIGVIRDFENSLSIKSFRPFDFKSPIIDFLNSRLYQKKNFR